jgi:hypothetical protein
MAARRYRGGDLASRVTGRPTTWRMPCGRRDRTADRAFGSRSIANEGGVGGLWQADQDTGKAVRTSRRGHTVDQFKPHVRVLSSVVWDGCASVSRPRGPAVAGGSGCFRDVAEALDLASPTRIVVTERPFTGRTKSPKKALRCDFVER